MTIGIYMYENKINHKKYIGQSINIEKRKIEHYQWPSPYSKIDSELTQYGEGNFNFIIIEECKPEELNEKEIYYIKKYNSLIPNGYNLIQGGQNFRGESNPSAKLSEKQVLKIIELLKEHKLNNKQISKLYNISRNTIDGINRCLEWTHLHNFTKNIRQESLDKLKYAHSSHAGENNPTSKITEETALKIIKWLESDNRSMGKIAKEENISIHIISGINTCKTWTYLHNYKKILEKN